MFWIETRQGIARMEAFNDDFLVSVPSLEMFEELQQPLKKACTPLQITVRTLSKDQTLETFNEKSEGSF